FGGPSAVETMHAILKEDPADLTRTGAAVPPALERIVRRCLEKNPEQRFQSAKDLGFNLEAIAAESGASVVVPAATLPLDVKRRPRLVPAIAIGLAIVAAAVGGFVAARSTSFTPQPAFTRLTFRRGTVLSARFAPDGQTIVYSAAWQGNRPELFSTRVG